MTGTSQQTAERRTSRRHFLKLAGGAALTVVGASALLTACGDDEGVSGSAPPFEPSATSAMVSPERGGTLRVALTGDPPSLDMQQTTDSIVLLVTSHIYETLFTWDAEYRPVPLLAAAHEISDDGLVHRVTLREGVTFHSGAALTAVDVIASVQRWGANSGLGEDLLAVTTEIVEIDAGTIEFRLSERFGTFAMALSRQLQGCAIYPKAVLDASTDNDLSEQIGTGPYRFVEWQPDRHIRLERFDDYAQPNGEPGGYAGGKGQYLDAIEFVPVRAEASRIAGLQSRDYHFLETVSPDQVGPLLGASGVAVDILPADSWLNIVLNLRSPVLGSLDVRRAVQLALDHEAIMRAAFGDGFYELTPELVPGSGTWYSEAGKEHFNQHRPDEARTLLASDGYDGTPLRLITTQEVTQEYNATLTMKQQLETVGFTIDLQVYDGATLSDRRNDDTLWEMYTATASFRPDPVMRNLTGSATGWWEDAEKDRLLAELQSESDYDKRFAIWEQVQARFYEDVPRLKIGNSRRVLARSASLQGVGPTEMQPEFTNAWLASDE